MTIFKRTSKKIYQEQVHLLFANSMASLTFSMLAGALLCWSLRTVIDKNVLAAWFGLFFTIFLLRIGLILLFRKQESGAGCKEHWHRRFLVGSCTSATLWGSASIFLFPEYSPAHQSTFFLIVTGVAAFGLASLCPSLPAVGGFLSLLLLKPGSENILVDDGP